MAGSFPPASAEVSALRGLILLLLVVLWGVTAWCRLFWEGGHPFIPNQYLLTEYKVFSKYLARNFPINKFKLCTFFEDFLIYKWGITFLDTPSVLTQTFIHAYRKQSEGSKQAFSSVNVFYSRRFFFFFRDRISSTCCEQRKSRHILLHVDWLIE